MDDQPQPPAPPESGPTRPSYWTPAPAGQSFAEIRMAVNAGGRLVVYQYCISVVLMSFKRSSAIRLVPGGTSRVLPGLRYSLVSLVLGWWGIPWGPFWTVQTIIGNLRGGTDVTGEILALDPSRQAGPP
jgi:hypothetical protein